MKKGFLTNAVLLITVISLSTFSASAATVNLYTDQTSAVSSTVIDYGVTFHASNSASSLHRVYATAQYLGNGTWQDDAQDLMDIGGNTGGDIASFDFATTHSWRLELNPEGYAYTNCTASGTVW